MDANATCVMDGNVLNIALSGSIDSTNAPAIQDAIMAAVAENTAKAVVNAARLNYISSAGLRALLTLKKKVGDVSIVEASSEVYEILEMTGFTELMSVTKAFRTISVEGCKVLGEGGNGIVYRLDPETVAKVYKKPDALPEIYRERELARKAFVMGLPTAIPFDVVKVGERYGSVFELLNARSVTECIIEEPKKIDDYIGQYIDILKLMHRTEDAKGELPDKRVAVLGWEKDLKGHLDEKLLKKFFRLIKALPDRRTLVHGDYHINNVEMQNGEAMLIDMDTLSFGHPVFDIASMFSSYIAYNGMDPDNAMKFFGLSSETCTYIWNKATELYAGSEEAAQDIREKGAAVSYAQVARWIIRHKDIADPAVKPYLQQCLEELAQRLNKLETLDF